MAPLYSQLKIFHYPEKLASLPRGAAEVLPPIHVRVKPTNVCNHGCSYCAYRSKNLQLGQDMRVKDSIPLPKMMEILDDFEEMGVQAVTFSGGGEPFCYPHFHEVVRRLAAGPIKFASLTNGSRLSGELAELFARKGSWLRVSIDGWDGPSYARYRSVSEGEFAKVMANLSAFKNLGGPCRLGVSLIVDQGNAAHVRGLIQTLKDAGVDSVKVSPCILDNSGRKNNEYHQPLFDTVRAQLEAAKSMADGRFEIYDAYHVLDDKFDKPYSWCPYIQILSVIGADQCVYTCQDKAYTQSGLLGSIRDCRFRDFWRASRERFFRVDPSRDCGHHCVANNKNKLIIEYLDCAQAHLPFV